jgi:hypothetical protein
VATVSTETCRSANLSFVQWLEIKLSVRQVRVVNFFKDIINELRVWVTFVHPLYTEVHYRSVLNFPLIIIIIIIIIIINNTK